MNERHQYPVPEDWNALPLVGLQGAGSQGLGVPRASSGRIRARDEDFRVEEVLGFEPDGEGEHAMLRVQKRGLNTEQLVKILARHAGIAPRDVGFAGLKDRNAVTSQWFTLGLAGAVEPDWSGLDDEQITVLEVTRHRRKLRRGVLSGNRFQLRVTQLETEGDALATDLARVQAEGVPNYFGEQRFGHDGRNLESAAAMLFGGKRIKQHSLRGIFLSAARSYLFNRVLAQRVADGSWNRLMEGEVVSLDGSRSVFEIDTPDQALLTRLGEFDIHPSGPLWGRGELRTRSLCRELEEGVLASLQDWCRALEGVGLKQERRALRLPVRELEWEIAEAELNLSFFLPSGAYATSVLRELVAYS